jgi:hypothetical protein
MQVESRSRALPAAVTPSEAPRYNQPVFKNAVASRDIRVEFRGNRILSSAVLHRVVAGAGGPENPRALDSLTLTYRSIGYWRPKFSVKRRGSQPDEWEVTVDEGRQYVWGKVDMESDVQSSTTLSHFFPFQPGHPASLTEFKSFVDDYIRYMRDQGYADCSYVPSQAIDDATGTVSMQLRFEEGLRFTVTSVFFASREIQRLFEPMVGKPFSQSRFEATLSGAGLSSEDVEVTVDRSACTVAIAGRRGGP